jgi:hypothetical protein
MEMGKKMKKGWGGEGVKREDAVSCPQVPVDTIALQSIVHIPNFI